MDDIRKKVDEVNASFMAAFEAGDAAACAHIYTEDGKVLPPGGATVTGRPAIESFWSGVMAQGVKRVSLETVDFRVDGSTGAEEGRFTLFGDDGEIDSGKFVVLWRAQADGNWLWDWDIFNSGA